MGSDYGSKSDVDGKVSTNGLSTHYHPLNSGYSVASLPQVLIDLDRLNHWDPEDKDLVPKSIIKYVNEILIGDTEESFLVDEGCGSEIPDELEPEYGW